MLIKKADKGIPREKKVYMAIIRMINAHIRRCLRYCLPVCMIVCAAVLCSSCAGESLTAKDLEGYVGADSSKESTERSENVTGRDGSDGISSSETSSPDDISEEGGRASSNEKSDDQGVHGVVQKSTEATSETEKESLPSETAAEDKANKESTAQVYSCNITIDGGEELGIIFSGTIEYTGSASVYDILCKSGADIIGSSYYISAINGLAEKEHGAMSGWLYQVNGETPMVSCGAYKVEDGDSIYWFYRYDDTRV